MPVWEIGGISRANLAGVASLRRKAASSQDSTRTRQSRQADISILKEGQELFHERVSLAPENGWMHELPNADAQAKYTIEIKDAKGATLLHQTEGEYDWTPRRRHPLGVVSGPETTTLQLDAMAAPTASGL